MAPTQWLSDEDMRTWMAYLQLSRHLTAGLERHLAGSGLSSADYQVLVPLSVNRPDGLRPRELVLHTGWARSRMAHQLRRMEQRQLLTREECDDDGRGTLVRATADGISALRHATPRHLTWVRTHFTELLSSEEKQVLVDISERVVAKLEG